MSLSTLSFELYNDHIVHNNASDVFRGLPHDMASKIPGSYGISENTSALIASLLDPKNFSDRLFRFLQTFDRDALYELARSDLLDVLHITIPDSCPVKSARAWCYYILGRKKGILKKWADVPQGNMKPFIRLIDIIYGGEPIKSAESITDADVACIELLPEVQRTMIWLRIIEVNPALEKDIEAKIGHTIIRELAGNEHHDVELRAKHTLFTLRRGTILNFRNNDARILRVISREGIEGAVMSSIPHYGVQGPSIIPSNDSDLNLLVDDLCDLVYKQCVELNNGEESQEAKERLSKKDQQKTGPSGDMDRGEFS